MSYAGQSRTRDGRQLIVALHGSKPIPIGTFKSIIEGSGLDVEDFRLTYPRRKQLAQWSPRPQREWGSASSLSDQRGDSGKGSERV